MEDDDGWEEEEVLDNATYCPSCEAMTAHEILHEKKVGNGADFKVRCQECQHVHTVVFRPPPPTNIPFILTDGPQSTRVVLVVDADEEFVVGDVFEENEMLWRIHQIELRNGQHTSGDLSLIHI